MKIVWASSVVLALGLIVDGALVLKYRVAHMPQVQMAARPTLPEKTLTSPLRLSYSALG